MVPYLQNEVFMFIVCLQDRWERFGFRSRIGCRLSDFWIHRIGFVCGVLDDKRLTMTF